MKPWSCRKAQVCSTHTCNGSVRACCNSSGHLQNWLFLPLLSKTWLLVTLLSAPSPAGWVALMWSEKPEEPEVQGQNEPDLPKSLFCHGVHPPGAAHGLWPALGSLTWIHGFLSLPPSERFHNRLKFRVRRCSLVHSHAGFYFAQQQPPLSKHLPYSSLRHFSLKWNNGTLGPVPKRFIVFHALP